MVKSQFEPALKYNSLFNVPAAIGKKISIEPAPNKVQELSYFSDHIFIEILDEFGEIDQVHKPFLMDIEKIN